MNKEIEQNITQQVQSCIAPFARLAQELKDDTGEIKDVMNGHNTKHEADIKDIKEYHEGNTEKFHNIITKLAVIEESGKGLNHRLDILNGKVPKNTERINQHAEILARLTAVVEGMTEYHKKEDAQRVLDAEDKSDDRKWWRDKTFWLVSVFGLAIVSMLFQSRGVDQDQINKIVELVNQANGQITR